MTTVRIGALYIYPVKSARGIELDTALLTTAGLADDRRWMVVNESGRFLTQREVPRLALIHPALTARALRLRAHAMPDHEVILDHGNEHPGDARRGVQVQCWKDLCLAFDEGDAAATWVSHVIGVNARLVQFDPSQRRLSAAAWTGTLEAENRFTDAFPLLTLGSASLADLNARLSQQLPMNRFRPNLVLDGLEPYDEDRVDELYNADITLRLVKPCVRCRITTIDQDTGTPTGDEPLRTLKTYRYDSQLHGVLFGQNALIVTGAGAVLRRGQEFQLRWKAGSGL